LTLGFRQDLFGGPGQGEATFATVRLRQRVAKGPGNRAAGVAMAFKLIESAQTRWRCVNAPHLVVLVRAGATFSTASSSNDPATKINKEAINWPRETHPSTGLDYSSWSGQLSPDPPMGWVG